MGSARWFWGMSMPLRGQDYHRPFWRWGAAVPLLLAILAFGIAGSRDFGALAEPVGHGKNTPKNKVPAKAAPAPGGKNLTKLPPPGVRGAIPGAKGAMPGIRSVIPGAKGMIPTAKGVAPSAPALPKGAVSTSPPAVGF